MIYEIVQKRKAWKALLIFAGLVVAASTGMADIMVCALTAAFLMIVTGCLQIRDAYRGVFRGQRLLRHTHRIPDQSAGIRTGRLPLQ